MKFLMLAIKYIATTLQTYFGRKGALAGWKGALADWKGALAGCFCNREFYLYHIACLLRDPSKKKYFDYMFFKEIFQFIFASLQVLFFCHLLPIWRCFWKNYNKSLILHHLFNSVFIDTVVRLYRIIIWNEFCSTTENRDGTRELNIINTIKDIHR